MFKKTVYSLAALAAMCVGATSCSSDEPAVAGATDEAVEITLAFNDGGEVASRSARPVYSSEAFNTVNEVAIKLLVKDNENSWAEATGVEIEGVTDGTLEWTPATEAGVKGDVEKGRNVNKTLKVKGLTAGASYKIVAYGYNNNTKDTEVVFANGEATATPKTNTVVEEIFAGAAAFSADAEGHVATNVTVTMKRQVAGVLGYFKNIPATAGDNNSKVKGVRVVASAHSTAYNFSSETGVNGVNTVEEDSVLISCDIPADAEAVAGIYHFTTTKTAELYTADNSVLGGGFLAAFGTQTGKATLRVELFDKDGVTLKSWNVKNGTETSYAVNRNQFYMIGAKYRTAPVDPENPEKPNPDPENPDPTPDEPIDLSTASEIELILNDAWDVIHNLTLDITE